MRMLELSILYGIAGAGCSAAWLARRGLAPSQLGNAAILLLLWPVYAPFLLLQQAEDTESSPGSDALFLAALRRASSTPLAALLPDEATVSALANRLRVAASKVREIDSLLGGEEFSEVGASRRLQELRDKGANECALSAVTLRLQNIRRLKALRNRFARELEDVTELLIQLRTQADVVRLAGTPDPGTRDLVREIVSRVEGLDQMMDDGALSCEGAADG